MEVWEISGKEKNQSYIQNFKCEIIAMRHNKLFLSTILCKLLETQVLSLHNQNNPFSETQQYARTGNIKFIRKQPHWLTFWRILTVTMLLLEWLMWRLWCMSFFCNDGISTFPVRFDDKEGFWYCNLWYSNVSILDCLIHFQVGNMIEEAYDFFLLLRHKESKQSIILCHSWSTKCLWTVRTSITTKEYILMK